MFADGSISEPARTAQVAGEQFLNGKIVAAGGILATALSTAVAAAAWLGMNDGSWSLAVPVVDSAAAALRPTRVVVAIAMIVTAAVVVLGIDGSGVLFGASVVSLMLALNHLPSAATHVRRSTRRPSAASRS